MSEQCPPAQSKIERGKRPDTGLVGALFSCLMAWEINPQVDQICLNDLHLSRPARRSIGCKGAGGYLSFPIPQASKKPEDDWSISSTMTGQRILVIVSLIRSLICNYCSWENAANLMRDFASIIPPESLYSLPSMSLLIKYWQDTIPDIQEAARLLINRGISSLSSSTQSYIVNFWSRFVPIKDVKSKSSCRATIILGLFGTIVPDSLNTRICKDVCSSLESIILDPVKTPYRLLAIEVVGYGFKTWEPHLNGQSMIKSLSNLCGLKGQSQASSIYLTQPSMMMARQSLISIASVNPGLFVSTLSMDLVHSKDIWDKVGSLKLLGLFITKCPSLLYPHLPIMVDSMVKMLDPNSPVVRESLQNIVTINFAELVKQFPMVDFHAPSQRLALGTQDGTSVIYDLRTATKMHILEGHTTAVNGLSFCPTGKLLATLAAKENQISFWQPSTGFLDSLKGAFGQNSQHISLPIGTGKVRPFRTFPIGKPHESIDIQHALDTIKLEWTGERSLRMSSIDVQLTFSI